MSHLSTATRRACDAVPGMSQLSGLETPGQRHCVCLESWLGSLGWRCFACCVPYPGCTAAGPHCISSSRYCCRPAWVSKAVQSLCLLPWPLHLWRHPSWHGVKDASLLFQVRVPSQAGLDSLLLPVQWRFASLVHTKAGEGQFCMFSSVAETLQAEARRC